MNSVWIIFFFSPLPPPAKKIKLADKMEKKCSVPHVLQGELARLCSRFQVKSGAKTGVKQSSTLLQCSISKQYSAPKKPFQSEIQKTLL